MTIRQMELFARVYELRNLTRAAEAMYMTQSAVTQNLKKMEDELGVTLFERSSRQFVPSAAGDGFYLHVKRILAEYDSALSELVQDGEHLSFHYFRSASSSVSDRIIAAFWQIDPNLIIDQADSSVYELMDTASWSSGILYLAEEEIINDNRIKCFEAAEMQHVLMMREDNRLSQKGSVRPEDLEGETIWVRMSGQQRFKHMSDALTQLAERGIHCNYAEADRARELIPKILSFGGVAIVPEYVAGTVPGIITKPYEDGIRIRLKLAYIGKMPQRVQRLLTEYRKRYAK